MQKRRGSSPRRRGRISDETPGREFVDRAREALSADEVAHAAEAGRGLTIKETLDLARTPDTTPV